jgi:hypothetical protein
MAVSLAGRLARKDRRSFSAVCRKPKCSGSGDSKNLSRIEHRDGARPRTLAGGLLIEHRNAGHGHWLRRSPRVRGRRHAWRRSEHPRCRTGRGDHRWIGGRVAHPERRDVRQWHEVGDRRQRHRSEGIMGRPGGYGKHRRRNAHVAHYLSAVGNQNRHTTSVTDRSAVFNNYGWVQHDEVISCLHGQANLSR